MNEPMKILVVDNTIDRPWRFCADFRSYLQGQIVVRRAPEEDLPADLKSFTHVILSGSRTCILDSSPWVRELMRFVRRVDEAKIPMLGVCYGHQIIARSFGGDSCVRVSPTPEIGWVKIRRTGDNPVLEGLPSKFHSFQSHFEEVCKAPPGFVVTAGTERCPIQAYYVEGKPIFGVQFHPERNAEEGQKSIDSKKAAKPPLPRDCIFGDGEAKSVFSENVAHTIFRNFLGQRGKR